MSDTFPEEFYRGLSAKDAVTAEGYVTAAAFSFDSYDGASRNDDGYCELSINWNDDEGALQTLLNQKKPFKEEFQFKVGYCTITKSMLHIMFKAFMDDKCFDYERRPIVQDEEKDIAENPYHGNLLMKNTTNKNIKKNIQHSLATLATGNVVIRDDVAQT